MGDGDAGAALLRTVQGAEHHALALGVQGGGGLVQQEHRGVPHQSPGNRDPLLLPSRQLGSLLPHRRLVALEVDALQGYKAVVPDSPVASW